MQAKITTGQGSGGSSRQILTNILPLETPLAIDIFNIHACNFKCKFCVQSLDYEKQGFHFDNRVMDMELLKKCVNDMKQFPSKVKMCRFVGVGEPLLHPEIDAMIKYVVDAKVAEKVEIITNGSLLSHEMSDRLINAGLPQLRISVEGLDAETYEEVTGVKIDFEQFVNNIRYFYKNKKNTILNIKAVDYNIKTKAQEKRFYEIFGNICDTIAIEHIQEMSSKVDYSLLSSKMIKKTLRGDNVEYTDICPFPFYLMQICPDGTVNPCCSQEVAPILGDCRKESLAKIWKNEVFNKFRYCMLDGKQNCPQVCQKCTQYLYNMFPEDKICADDVQRLKGCYGDQL